MIRKYRSLILSLIIAFIIPFYPVYILLTNTELELAAVIVIVYMFVAIPIGFFSGLLSYTLFTRSVPKQRIGIVFSVGLFLTTALLPFLMFVFRMNQLQVQYQYNVREFALTATILSEEIVEKRNSEGEKSYAYKYSLEVDNPSDKPFSVSISDYLYLNQQSVTLGFGRGYDFVIQPGSQIITNEISLSNNQKASLPLYKSIILKISIVNTNTHISKLFELPSQINNWEQILSNIKKQQQSVVGPEGYERFRQVEKGVQLDLPTGWGQSYGFDGPANSREKLEATHHFFGKAYVGNILLQWDNYLPYSNYCIEGKNESSVEHLMNDSPIFLNTLKKLNQKGIRIRICIEDESKVSEIKNILNTLEIIN